MKKLSLVRGLLLAAFCAAGSLVAVPQSASANTILGVGASATIDFVVPNGSYSSIFLDVGSLVGTVDFWGGSTSSFTFNGGSNQTAQLFDSYGGGTTLYATIINKGTSGYDTVALGLTANTTAGSINIPDSVSFTPIPASLPLFLTGAGLLYGFARRRGSRERLAA
jgi:hypothetical protein